MSDYSYERRTGGGGDRRKKDERKEPDYGDSSESEDESKSKREKGGNRRRSSFNPRHVGDRSYGSAGGRREERPGEHTNRQGLSQLYAPPRQRRDESRYPVSGNPGRYSSPSNTGYQPFPESQGHTPEKPTYSSPTAGYECRQGSQGKTPERPTYSLSRSARELPAPTFGGTDQTVYRRGGGNDPLLRARILKNPEGRIEELMRLELLKDKDCTVPQARDKVAKDEQDANKKRLKKPGGGGKISRSGVD